MRATICARGSNVAHRGRYFQLMTNTRAFRFLLTLGLAIALNACVESTARYDAGGSIVPVGKPDASSRPDVTGLDLPALPPDVGENTSDVQTLTDSDEPSDAQQPTDTKPAPDQGNPDTYVPGPDVTTDPLPLRSCDYELRYSGNGATVQLAGTFGDSSTWWTPMDYQRDGNDWVITVTDLQAGTYAYKVVIDGADWIADPGNPRHIWGDGDEFDCRNDNSKLEVPDCHVPLLELESLDRDVASGTIDMIVRVYDGADGNGIDEGSLSVTLDGEPFTGFHYDPTNQRMRILLQGADAPNKYGFRINVSNADGAAEELFLPVWLEDKSFLWEDSIMYFLFVDRFANGNQGNDGAAGCWEAADWMGGDWAGALDRLDWIADLGVNTIWLTAPVNNPDSCGEGIIPGKWYASYHGYHPASARQPENHFGTMDEFKTLVDAAHARGIRVLVDAVINHLHSEHPWVDQHSSDPDWFNRATSGNISDLICGTGCGGNCWDSAPVECWFTADLPDLNYCLDEPAEEMIAELVWWAKEANLDGFRVDAVKHIRDNFVAELRADLGDQLETTGDDFYMVGETFVGGDQGSIDLLNRYIGPDLLHGQFDFPLYWEIRNAFASEDGGLDALSSRLMASQEDFPLGLMGNFLGNHDVTRFLSAARGDNDDAQNPPAQPSGSDAGVDALFGKLRLAFGFLMTIPGIPLIYYGDEVGLAGVGDPDNRRMMMFDGFPAQQQSQLLSLVQALGNARLDFMALRRGSVNILEASTEHLAYGRTLSGAPGAIVALNRSDSTWQPSLNAGDVGWSSGQTVTDVVTGNSYTVDGNSRVSPEVPPKGAQGGVVVLVAN